MSIRSLSIRACVPATCFLAALTVTVSPSFAQQPSGDVQRVQTPVSAPPSAAKEPDYPDPRSFFLGVSGLAVTQYSGPDIRGGVPAEQSQIYESLYNIGKPSRYVFEAEGGIPITRTGMLYAEFERFHGDSTQILTRSPYIDSIQFNTGDVMRSSFQFTTGRIYLDDLLFPHKFPVARLRFKSIWGIRYISAQNTVISPTEDDVSGVPGSSFGVGTEYILYPEFGLGMEYALTKHSLFHVDSEGFAFPHRAVMGEGNATYSWRHQNLELLMGVKFLHFKTSPQKEEYMLGTWTTPFVGVRWYF
ncbi:MAG TPA: hypothetical protein VHC90_11260 [Bryobacteraceae bacterium]|nr:hypothetical protein [Bryobacteraceae bacterium]